VNDTFYRTMVLFRDIIEVADLPNSNGCPMVRIVASDGYRIGLIAIKANRLRPAVAADRLG
jgi:hypothetical protein